MNLENPSKTRAKTAARASALRWQGAIEGMHRGIVYGWAVDRQNPQTRVVLELCCNGEAIRSVIADVARTDLAADFAAAVGTASVDVCHGFAADLGLEVEHPAGALTIRVANTDTVLGGTLALEAPDKPPVAALSRVVGDGALRLHGWAIDPANNKRSVNVRAFVGDAQVAETTANLMHPAVRGFDVGAHSFSLGLPLALGDGRVHSVRVVDEQGEQLNGSPLTICTLASGLKALLPDGAAGLATEVVDNYERHLPRSLGMGQYQQWSALFEAEQTPAQPLGATVGLIVTGSGADAASAATAASIKAQLGATVRMFSASAKGGKAKSFASLLNAALDAGCEVLGCVRAGDTLPPHAIATALEGFRDDNVKIVYTDSEHEGKPWFKPAWNADYALASDYPLELLLVHAEILNTMRDREGAPADHASFAWQSLSAMWPTADITVAHVPHVLYRYNSPLTQAELGARTEAAKHIAKIVEPALHVTPLIEPPTALFQPRRVQRLLTKRERNKTVSLVIPTRDRVELLERCISTIVRHTDWPNLEIIVIDNGSTEAKTKTYFRKLAKQGVTVLPMPGPFNYADLNNRAIDAARGEIIGLINNDIEAMHGGWLDEIVGQLLRPGVGAVGAKLLWPNGMVQHGGVLLGVGNAAGHFGNRLADADWGDHGRNQLVQQVSGVTAACLFLRKKDFIAVGGMDPVAFPVAFNDVDLCLKLRAAGKTITWTPHATLLHAESASRGHEDTPQKRARAQRELDQLRQRWGKVLLRDPAYHPSLNLDAHSHAFGGLALPPRDRSPRTGAFPKAPT